MPALTATAQASGARSVSFGVLTAGAADTVSNAEIVAACDGGYLKSMLSESYASAAAFLSAFGDEGGIATASGAGLVSVAWDVDGLGKPTLALGSTAAVVATVRIALAWSASS